MPETVGRYEILEKIGQGGMGAVYKAFDPLLRRTVAVKVIAAVLDGKSEIRERFFREARSAGQLSHKNIIVIYDLGEDGGRPFIAMEFLSGAALGTRMAGGGRLSVSRAVEVMTQVCHGLDYAHTRGVVHRDVTPANIFITDTDEVKILDFGLAHLVASELTRSETIMGTANYMSPEQVRGERVDRRADIFAAGVLLYELLSGRKAFEGDSFANTLFMVLESAPASLHGSDPTLPGPLVAIVERALAKRREDRYQTAAEMLHDLVACREWVSGSARVPVATMAPTIVGSARPAAAPAAVPPAAPPQSVVWSPRRVRTTALVGGALALVGGLLLFESRDKYSNAESSAERIAVSAPPTATPPAPQPGPAPAPSATSIAPASPEPQTAPPRETAKTALPAARDAGQRATDLPGTSAADRTRADQAIARARQTRRTAEQAGSEGLAVYRKAISTEGEAAGLYAAGQFARAASRAVEAEAMYRAAEIEGRAEQAARERLKAESAAAAPRTTEPPATAPAPVVPPRVEARETPPPPVQPDPPPQADPRGSIRTVINNYVAALEARSIGGLKTLWPSLSAAQEQAIRAEFANTRTLQVRLADLRIDVDGAGATVTATRDYQLMTADGHRLASTTRMTMRLRRTGEAWLIESVAYQ